MLYLTCMTHLSTIECSQSVNDSIGARSSNRVSNSSYTENTSHDWIYGWVGYTMALFHQCDQHQINAPSQWNIISKMCYVRVLVVSVSPYNVLLNVATFWLPVYKDNGCLLEIIQNTILCDKNAIFILLINTVYSYRFHYLVFQYDKFILPPVSRHHRDNYYRCHDLHHQLYQNRYHYNNHTHI